MMRMGAKGRIRLLSLVLFVAIAIVWALFYAIISGQIADNATSQMMQVAGQIIERLGSEFLRAENMLGRLTRDADVMELAAGRAPELVFPLAVKIEDELDTSSGSPDFIENIIVYAPDSHYHRLTGSLGNKACARLGKILADETLPRHLAVALEGESYIGYADHIQLGDNNGIVAILIEEENVLELIRAYDQSGSLMVLISADGEPVTANTGQLDIFSADDPGRPVIHSRLGITPFEVSVAADARYLDAAGLYFTIVAIVTAVLIGIVLLLYSGVLNQQFFKPMVKTIDSIENLNTDIAGVTLPPVQSAEFDRLIEKINAMLRNLETKNNEVKSAELRAVTAEIEKHRALIIALKKQINAHLMINTLEGISTLVDRGEYDKAQTIETGLITLLQYAHNKDEYISIWDEWDILERFVVILNIRYEDKLNVDFDFDDHLMWYVMPRMMLQPLIENAVMHGFDKPDENSRITVKAELTGKTVTFTVSDNGFGMSEKKLMALRESLNTIPDTSQGFTGVALLNIKNRLSHYYGDAAGLQIHSVSGEGTRVIITIPPDKGGRE